jgi:hypothetical protein
MCPRKQFWVALDNGVRLIVVWLLLPYKSISATVTTFVITLYRPNIYLAYTVLVNA